MISLTTSQVKIKKCGARKWIKCYAYPISYSSLPWWCINENLVNIICPINPERKFFVLGKSCGQWHM